MQRILKARKICIVVDSREKQSNVVYYLSSYPCSLVFRNVGVGDYICSEKVCVERKTINDFVSSIVDGRLFSQLESLKESYEKPVLIIEEYEDEIYRDVSDNVIYGAIARCIAEGVSVIFSKSSYHTAKLIYYIAKKEQELHSRDVAFKPKPKAKSFSEQQVLLVASLPNVNTTLAKRLLRIFKTPRNVFNASEKQLQRVPGIGEKKAKAIFKLLNEQWKEENIY
jgi:Fanconi anemia group M protein